MSHNKPSNPFVFEQSSTTTNGVRKLDFTPDLIARSNSRASDLMITVSEKPELHDLANRMMNNGEAQDLIDLIHQVYDADLIKSDSQLLNGADDDQLSRLLESRRSDRSKAKKKGLTSSVTVCRTYISAMYAEMLIRKYWNKPYSGSVANGITVDKQDLDSVNRKIKSLQSKKSRMKKLVEADPAKYGPEYQAIEAEISRLSAYRPNNRVKTQTVVKDLSVEQIREVLLRVDPETLSESDKAAYKSLMSKLG